MKKQSHKLTSPLHHRICALALVVSTTCSPALAASKTPTIPGFYGKVPMPNAPDPGTLPQFRSGTGLSGAPEINGNTMTVNQNVQQATIDWKSFNIAPDSVVVFNQKNNGVAQPNWAALNRIYDANPSLIFGSIKADGKVYLVNRNGILFGPNSQVNVRSLVASNLNITDANFQNGKLRFTTAADPEHPELPPHSDDAFVSNYGTITTDSGGSVFFVGPNVVNAGTISSPSGKINLVGVKKRDDGTTPESGHEVELVEVTADATGNDVTYSDLQVAGAAYNAETGRLITEGGGRVGMYGATVQHDGLIRTVTALKKGGVVFLAARDKVTTGEKSVIATPIDGSTETAAPSFNYSAGVVGFKGLSTVSSGSADIKNPLGMIEHQGAIVAPSGEVTLTAKDRVYLGDSSSIDVAGLWLDRAASDNLLEAQLNSVYLRDDYGQKSGILLGQKIKVDVLTGSNIGNLSTYYTGIEHSAQERSTKGGRIVFGNPSDINTDNALVLNELIVKQGALLDFSGGGTRYAAGTMATSRLISGNKVYDLGSCPQWVQYDRVADSQTKTNKRFGITKQFSGLYFGGGSPVQDLTAGRVVGSDAGSVVFKATVTALDGALLGGVTRGLYQTSVTPYVTKDDSAADYQNYKISVARGLEEPVGGSVTIGQELNAITGQNDHYHSFNTTAIEIKQSASPLPASFNSDDDLNRETTEISAAILNKAGLSHLSLFANTFITTEQGADISLLPGGNLIARARRIEHLGAIDVPGGSVEMTTRPNISSTELIPNTNNNNPLYQALVETIFLGKGSSISVAGLEIDNSAAGGDFHAAASSGHTAGGTITVQEMTEEASSNYTTGTSMGLRSPSGHSVNVAAGAILDVSGGWSIDAKGKISGANAGTLQLKGSTLSLGGELRGFSLPGKTGGEIRLHAGEVLVKSHDEQLPANMAADAVIPDYLLGKLVLGEDRLKDTGFSRISLAAIDDLTFMEGALLTPSLVKREMPVPAIAAQSTESGNRVIPAGSDPATIDYLGVSSLSLTAGKNIYGTGTGGDGPLPLEAGGGSATNNVLARIVVSSGTGLKVAPGGNINMEAPAIEIAGSIEAAGGGVSVTATNGDLTVKSGGDILAKGHNKPATTTVAGLPAGPAPQGGGTISMKASLGSVVLEAGSQLDVSGSEPVERLVAGVDGKPVAVTVAGDPGKLSLSYGTGLTLDGEIAGRGNMAGIRGGDLEVKNLTADLEIREADIDRYQNSGFDALTFAAPNGSLKLPQAMDVSVGRSLTLDSKIIEGAPDGEVIMRAPWISLSNTTDLLAGTPAAETGTGRLTLAGGFIDVKGSIQMSGFQDVTLRADHDVRLFDRLKSNPNEYVGDLGVSGNLTLQAARVYPTSMTDFTITAKGKVAILPAETADPAPVYSAGGSLAIAAEGGIEHYGVLAAPQGNIALIGGTREKTTSSDGTVTIKDTQLSQVYLAEGSSILTGGSVPVAYGNYDGSTWTTKDGAGDSGGKGPEVASAPANSITLSGSEVVVEKGAVQDVSGGGSVYTTFFQAGIPGSNNPLTKSGRYVILPDNSVKLPGQAVYLDAAPAFGLKAGVYSILPADYAFLPGALVIEDTGLQLPAGQKALSAQGYQVVAGYRTVTDTSIGSQACNGYSIRTATDVLKEGDFTVKRFSGADAGNFTLAAKNGAYYDGTLSEKPLAGGKGGIVTFSARNVQVVADKAASPVPADKREDTLQLETAIISNRQFSELRLGDRENTETVTFKGGAALQASSVTLSAKSGVTLEDNAHVTASGEGSDSGVASVVVPQGTFALNESASLRASHGIKLDVRDTDLKGEMSADNSSMSLAADRIVFAANDTDQGAGALYLTESRWSRFTEYEDLTLVSRADMEFQRDVENLSTAGSLTLDTPRFTGSAGAATVNIEAKTRITLLNSGATPTAAPVAGTTTLSLNAPEIVVAPRLLGDKGTGNIVFDRFGSVALNSTNDLVLKGAGTVKTGGADLTLAAARVTTSFYKHDADPSDKTDVSIPFTAADITLDAGSGAVTLAGSQGTRGTTITPGGSLQIRGRTITQNGGVLEVPAGQVTLSATDNIGINADILARGIKQSATEASDPAYFPGGRITLESGNGSINLASGSTLDVSSHTEQGDAGSIRLSAPDSTNGGVSVAPATLLGKSATGRGGSLAIDSRTLDGSGGLDGLSKTLADGGFSEKVSIRSRMDNTLSLATEMKGREVVIAADGGSIVVTSEGAINANGVNDGDAGGRVELYAQNALTLESGSVITATGKDGADGGTVSLSTLAPGKLNGGADYALRVQPGARMDVSGGAGGSGGGVSFRAYQINGNDVNMDSLAGGTIAGASEVSVEAAKRESGLTSITTALENSYTTAAATFMANNAATIKNRLFGAGNPDNHHLRAGIELVSDAGADLTLANNWDLSAVRPGGEPGVVTLRAGKDLIFNANLVDRAAHAGANDYQTLHSSTMGDSWALNLVAGADAGADYRAAKDGTGDLNIASGKVVYTENAPISFSAGNNATMSGSTAAAGPGYMINTDMKYNLASYGGTIRGNVGSDLNLNSGGSAIQTALGDIDIRVGGNLGMGSSANSAGAIRTTGEYLPGKVEIAPGLSELIALPEFADLLNPEYNPTNGKVIINPSYTNPKKLTNGTLIEIARLIFANGGNTNGAGYVDATVSSYWTYRNGGNISLDVNGSVKGNLDPANGWDGAYIDSKYVSNNFITALTPWYLAAGFGGSKENGQSSNIPVTVGIATMGGGDIAVRTGGSLLTQVGAFGRENIGNLTVTSGGDMIGRFRVTGGTANLMSGGLFGRDDANHSTYRSVIEIGGSQLPDAPQQAVVAAQGDVNLGAVLNPDNSRDRIFMTIADKKWNLTYSQGSMASISSLAGDATIFGTDVFNAYDAGSLADIRNRQRILPATFSFAAAGDLNIQNQFAIAPSTMGNLSLHAGGDISGAVNQSATQGSLHMADVDIDRYYGRKVNDYDPATTSDETLAGELIREPSKSDEARSQVNHADDTGSVVTVVAGAEGNIDSLKLVVNKQARVTAGKDITRLIFTGQNSTDDSFTSIVAGGSIDQGVSGGSVPVNSRPKIEIGGPGALLVQAGENMELGDSVGIKSIGNLYNMGFTGENTDSDVIVVAGARQALTQRLATASGSGAATTTVSEYFAELRSRGKEYAALNAEGKSDEAKSKIAEAREVIKEFFDAPDPSGESGMLSMLDSRITSGRGNIYVMARGDLDVGRTAINSNSDSSTGITTTFGGGISLYTGRDINVNESRVMTFMGGDMLFWTDHGNINAGRGSKTTVSSSGEPEYKRDKNGNLVSLVFKAPAVGSGARALTYDPDGSSGLLTAPEPGDIDFFAPDGVIDAGEAGIAGGNVTLGATQVLNTKNISFSAGSVGVPAATDSSVSIGVLGGNSSLGDSSKMIETASSGGIGKDGAKHKLAQSMDDILSKYLDVKVIGFDMDTLPTDSKDAQDEQDGKKRKK